MTLDLQGEKLLLIHMVVGEDMEEVLSLGKTLQRWIDQLRMLLDGLQRIWLQMDFVSGQWFR